MFPPSYPVPRSAVRAPRCCWAAPRGAAMSGGEADTPPRAEPWPGAIPSANDQDQTEMAAALARDVQSLRTEAAALRTALRAVLEALEPLEVLHALQPALADGIYRA